MSRIDRNKKKAERLMKKGIYPQDKIIRSRVWKWLTIIVTFFGLVGGVWLCYQIYDHFTKEEFTIEQSVDPETMKRLRELKPGESINVEKGRPVDEPE